MNNYMNFLDNSNDGYFGTTNKKEKGFNLNVRNSPIF